jgi:hypothetical protein
MPAAPERRATEAYVAYVGGKGSSGRPRATRGRTMALALPARASTPRVRPSAKGCAREARGGSESTRGAGVCVVRQMVTSGSSEPAACDQNISSACRSRMRSPEGDAPTHRRFWTWLTSAVTGPWAAIARRAHTPRVPQVPTVAWRPTSPRELRRARTVPR